MGFQAMLHNPADKICRAKETPLQRVQPESFAASASNPLTPAPARLAIHATHGVLIQDFQNLSQTQALDTELLLELLDPTNYHIRHPCVIYSRICPKYSWPGIIYISKSTFNFFIL